MPRTKVETKGRRLQVLLDSSGEGSSPRVRILSRVRPTKSGRCTRRAGSRPAPARVRRRATHRWIRPGSRPISRRWTSPPTTRAKTEVGIDLGPSFRTLNALWSRPGEALGEVSPPGLPRPRRAGDHHPLLLDGCFQVMGAARAPDGDDEGVTVSALRVGAARVAGSVCRSGSSAMCARGGDRTGEGGESSEVASADITL